MNLQWIIPLSIVAKPARANKNRNTVASIEYKRFHLYISIENDTNFYWTYVQGWYAYIRNAGQKVHLFTITDAFCTANRRSRTC
jgi:hypothetical protein